MNWAIFHFRCFDLRGFLAGLLIVGSLNGCGAPAGDPPPSVHGWRERAALPRLQSSPSQALRAELARLQDDGALPLQLAAATHGAPDSRLIIARPTAATDPAVALREAYPTINRGLLQQRIETIDPDRTWRVDPIQRDLLRNFITVETAKPRIKFQAAIELCNRGFGLNPAHGPLLDLAFLEPLELGCRVEGLAALDRLIDDRPDEALAPLLRQLRVAHALSQQPNVATRIAAANLRTDALAVLQQLAVHPSTTPAQLQQIGQLLDECLRTWPSDAVAWIGDRASGLVTYELVREGHYLSLLEAEQVARLEEQAVLKVKSRAVVRGADDDQLCYLQTMRQIIDLCQQPYYVREPALKQLRESLADRERTQQYPIVATELLLTDFEQVHRRQAEDYSRCVAWSLALQQAVGETTITSSIDALTGQPYRILASGESVSISGGCVMATMQCYERLSVARNPESR